MKEIFDLKFIETIDKYISSQDDWKFTFITNDEFKKLTIDIQNKEYWLEILKRISLSALLTLCKTNHWAKAINANKEIGNYYSFCASVRGFVESCADSIFSLKKIPLTIAKDYFAIYSSIHKFEGIVITHEVLENELIHFLQAKKLTKEELKILPNAYQAKHITEYLDETDGIKDDVKKLYSYLCGISHPGADSNNLFLFDHNNQLIICNDSLQLEKELIELLVKEQADVVNKLYLASVYYSFELIEIVNRFDVKELLSKIPNNISVTTDQSWNEIEEMFKSSRKLYEIAIKTGKYE